jgi:hypothetical protein
LFLFLGSLTVSGLHANICVTDLLSNYLTLPPSGCSIGTLNVVNFNYTLIAGTVAINASDITVTPQVAGNVLGLQFSSSKFSVSSPDFAQYLLTYTWDPGDIRSANDILSDPVVFPGLAQITKDLCPGAAFSGSTCSAPVVQLNVFDNGITSQLLDSANFSPPIAILGVRDTIDLDARTGGSVEIDNFINQVVIPEPDGVPVAGLLGIGLWLVRGRLRVNRR